MGALTMPEKKRLEERFGRRITFDATERKLYSHDVGEIPALIKPLIGSRLAEGVVQPRSEEELVELVSWAREQRIPLTPRGKATSGYGGVLPLKGGMVVDSYRLNRVVDLDPQARTVTVEAGLSWEGLDKILNKQNLTLCLYPTSYPASTVGGWLAQGGAGIGSYEAGWFRDNVVSARVVLPTGEVRELSGSELDLVSDAEGITGLISRVTLKVQPLEELEVVAMSTADTESLQELLQALTREELPIWSVSFINPRMVEMKNRTPLREHGGRPAEERLNLPEAYIITLAYRKRHGAAVQKKLPALLKACKGRRLSPEIARHEWEERFNVMQVKRLGPSLVPAEVVLPLPALAEVLGEIEEKIAQPVVKEGIVVRRGSRGAPEVVILGFIPADQRTAGYPFVFSLSLSIMKIAEKHGGRAYSTGLYFSGKALQVLGPERVKKLKAFKAQVDPRSFMNPGKVIHPTLVSRAIGLAGALEPLSRRLGNSLRIPIGERPRQALRGIPAEVAWYAYSCSQCGYCVDECDQFYGRGWESQAPRGKWYWLREYLAGREQWSQPMVDTILACTTCEMCDLRCSESLPIESSWMKLRGELIEQEKRMTFPPFEMMSAALQAEGNIWAGYRRDRTAWFPKDLEERHGPEQRAKVVYFAGCTASYVEQDIALATVRLLDEAGVDFTCLGTAENCCGTPMLVAGKWEVFVEIMRQNIRHVKAAGADTVVASCPACDMMWRQVYPRWAEKLGLDYGIRARHYSEVVAEKIKTGEFIFPSNGDKTVKVTWHDSCHIGRASGVYEPPRDLIRAIRGTELVEMSANREQSHCCGSVLTLIKEPPVAAEVGKVRLDEAREAGAEKVLALCPCCEFQLRVSADKKGIPIPVVDLARFAAEALGYRLPDPNPEVKKQWAAFEAMIALMTPQGFAGLMGTMWPELIAAMPLGLGPMMRLAGKIPGALTLMKPLFPVLFPRLMPLMLPKLMPVLLQRVEAGVPMPDYMAEQMPELMPKVMENLLPHLIGEVVPLVTQPLIDYLRGRRPSSVTS